MLAFFYSLPMPSMADDLNSILVGVPDPDLAAEVAAILPGIRVGVLQVHADEPDAAVNARALALRNATHLLFDHSKESPRLAMFRERLQVQGVVAINIGCSSLPLHKSARPVNAPPLEQLVTLLSFAPKNGQ
jgi:hypothetical protein